VSPLWRDEVAIYLAPRKVALARRARGLKTRISAVTEVAVPGGGSGDSGPALAQLAELLLEPTWADAAAHVVIADAWARYCIVPATAAPLDAEGRRAQARYVLEDAYGEGVSDWDIVLEDAPPGRISVACAMPEGLKAELIAALSPARLKLMSMQPQLVVAFNAWRRRLPSDDAWFIALEDGWLSAVHLAHGAWDRIHAARLSSEPRVELERLQAFGSLTRAAGSAGRMFVEAPPWMRERAKRSGIGLEWLEADEAAGGQAHELDLLMRASA
jgi:hypothetical protein